MTTAWSWRYDVIVPVLFVLLNLITFCDFFYDFLFLMKPLMFMVNLSNISFISWKKLCFFIVVINKVLSFVSVRCGHLWYELRDHKLSWGKRLMILLLQKFEYLYINPPESFSLRSGEKVIYVPKISEKLLN